MLWVAENTEPVQKGSVQPISPVPKAHLDNIADQPTVPRPFYPTSFMPIDMAQMEMAHRPRSNTLPPPFNASPGDRLGRAATTISD